MSKRKTISTLVIDRSGMTYQAASSFVVMIGKRKNIFDLGVRKRKKKQGVVEEGNEWFGKKTC
jgi:hypothetical protein